MDKPDGVILEGTPLEEAFPNHKKSTDMPDWMPSPIFVPDVNVLSLDHYWAMGYDYAVTKMAESYLKSEMEKNEP